MQNIEIEEVVWVQTPLHRIWIRNRWIRKILASRIRIHGAKYQPKTVKKNQIWSIEKRKIIKISWFLNGSSSFSVKISEKVRQKIRKFCFVKRIVNLEELAWIRLHFFSNVDPWSGSGSAAKLIGSKALVKNRTIVSVKNNKSTYLKNVLFPENHVFPHSCPPGS